MSQSDLTFITNEHCKSLLERFRVLIKDARLFDVLVGYFYTSGFHFLYKSLENTEKVRILIGIGTNKTTFNLINSSKNNSQAYFVFSHAEMKERFSEDITQEMELSEERQAKNKNRDEGREKHILNDTWN